MKYKPIATIGMITDFEKQVGMKIIWSSSLSSEDAHIVLISPFQHELLCERTSSLQTDSIEAYLVVEFCPNANLAVTSAYCNVLNRHIPLCVSILMGKSAVHYKAHFKSLFEAMDMPHDLQAWENAFPGNTSDFSDAECNGFKNALHSHSNLNTSSEISLERFYCC